MSDECIGQWGNAAKSQKPKSFNSFALVGMGKEGMIKISTCAVKSEHNFPNFTGALAHQNHEIQSMLDQK